MNEQWEAEPKKIPTKDELRAKCHEALSKVCIELTTAQAEREIANLKCNDLQARFNRLKETLTQFVRDEQLEAE